MSYVLKVDLPNASKGQQVSIPGLGVFEQGSTTELTDQAVERFRDAMGHTVDVTDSHGHKVGETWERGPTPLQAKWPAGVTVETSQQKKKEGDN